MIGHTQLITPHGDLEPAGSSWSQVRSLSSLPLMGIWNAPGLGGGVEAGDDLITPHGDLELLAQWRLLHDAGVSLPLMGIWNLAVGEARDAAHQALITPHGDLEPLQRSCFPPAS